MNKNLAWIIGRILQYALPEFINSLFLFICVGLVYVLDWWYLLFSFPNVSSGCC